MPWPRNLLEMNRKRLVPYLRAETPESRTAIAGDELLLPVLPFRVGRENRHLRAIGSTYLPPRERRDPTNRPSNDLYLPEAGGGKVHISRQHFLIHRGEDGRYYVLDRGSTLGTIVGGRKIGGNKKWGKAYLKPGDLIIPGARRSNYRFRFDLRPARTIALPKVIPVREPVDLPYTAGVEVDAG